MFNEGDTIVPKIGNVKLFASPADGAKTVATLSKGDEMIFMGEEQNGFLKVESGSGSGWVKKVLGVEVSLGPPLGGQSQLLQQRLDLRLAAAESTNASIASRLPPCSRIEPRKRRATSALKMPCSSNALNASAASTSAHL